MAKKLDLGQPEKFNIGHFYTQRILMKPWLHLWYKKFTVIGRENIDNKVPTIFAINHQNTAMDPLTVVGIISRPITWLARADLYNNKFLVPILHCFKILPIFRQRDGLKNLENNELVFDKIVDVLSKNVMVGIFPEGTHWGFRRLRQTRKAIPRIVELAEKKYNYSSNPAENPLHEINVIPIGIYYDDYRKIRSNLFIKIGEPISMKPYIEGLRDTPQATENEIKDAIEAGMRNCMLDIPQMDDTYNTVETLRTVCRETTAQKFALKGNKLTRDFLADKKTIEIVENEEAKTGTFLSSIKKKAAMFEAALQQSKFSTDLVLQDGYDAFHLIWNAMLSIVLLPLFILSSLFWGLDYIVMRKSSKIAKDPLFKNSIMFVVGRLFTLISNFIWAAIWICTMPFPWWTFIIFWIARFAFWPIFIDYPRLIKETIQGVKFNIALQKKDKGIALLCKLRDSIISEYKKLLQ